MDAVMLSMSVAPRPHTMPSSRSPLKGSRSQPAGLTGTTSVCPISISVGAWGSLPWMRVRRLTRPGAAVKRSKDSPAPERYASRASALRTSWPEAGVPSLTQAFRMRVRSSSVASVSMLLSSLTCAPGFSAGDGQAGQRGFGFGDQSLDHFARGDDVLDESCALAARSMAIFHVAFFAGPDGRGEAHALGLERKGQDLGRALLPLPREVVADSAAGLARRAAVHHRAVLVDGQNLLLVVVVAERLVGGDESRPHPHTDGAQREGGGQPAAVGDAARGHHGRRAHGIHHGRHQHEPADAARVPAGLMPLGDHHVHAVGGVIPCLLDVAAEGHDLHAEPVSLRGDGAGIAEPGHEYRDPLLERDVDPSLDLVRELLYLVAGGPDRGEQHVHAKGLVGEIADAPDLGAQVFGTAVRRRDDT